MNDVILLYVVLISSSIFIQASVGGQLAGYKIDKYDSLIAYHFDNDDMVPEMAQGATIQIRLFGNMTEVSEVALTKEEADCLYMEKVSRSEVKKVSPLVGVSTMGLPMISTYRSNFYFCLNVNGHWNHQGTDFWVKMIVVKPILNIPVTIIIIVSFILLSSVLNGLVVGLMSLDKRELSVLANAGTDKERAYSKSILRVRDTGNFLLVSLVVGSTLLNSTVTVLIDSLVSGWVTIIIVTILIVLFCEIIPNAVFSRYPLFIGAKMMPLTWTTMFVTFPVSYPLGKFLDKILGSDVPMYTRDRIKEMVKMSAKYAHLKKLEVDVMSGALDMNVKRVEEIMTLMSDVYMLPLESYLDYETIREIMISGYSRIPIYEGDRSNIVKVLHVRDLALLDPEDKTPVRLVIELMKDAECIYVEEGTTLDVVFHIFKEGTRGHMAFVYSLDPTSQLKTIVGVLTLEDIIEEICQVEIVDEFDNIVDNRSKRKREHRRLISDYLNAFAETFESRNISISPNLRIATYNFLASEIKSFHPDVVSPKVLYRLLRSGVIIHVPRKMGAKIRDHVIFSQETAHEGFVLIIEGRAQIIIKPDMIKSECGAFSYFGLLEMDEEGKTEPTKYDYTVEAIGEIRYLKIPKRLYLAAKRATECERNNCTIDLSEESFPGLFTDDFDDSTLGRPSGTQMPSLGGSITDPGEKSKANSVNGGGSSASKSVKVVFPPVTQGESRGQSSSTREGDEPPPLNRNPQRNDEEGTG